MKPTINYKVLFITSFFLLGAIVMYVYTNSAPIKEIGRGWDTYTSEKLGFQVKVPSFVRIESGAQKSPHGEWYKISTQTGSSVEATITINSPLRGCDFSYGSGVASKNVSETITINNTNYVANGWIEDAKNYTAWAKKYEKKGEVSTIIPETSPNYKRYYEKTVSLCEGGANIKYTLSSENLQNEEEVDRIEALVKEIISTIKII